MLTFPDKVRVGMTEVPPRARRHIDQLYIGVDLLFLTFTCTRRRHLKKLHCFLEALVIPRFTPADRLEFVNASKFFKASNQVRSFWRARCLMSQLRLIPKELRCPRT